MTRDTMLDRVDIAHPQRTLRRRTMATGQMREFLASNEPVNFGIDDVAAVPNCAAPVVAAPSPTRRMSIGELQSKIYDWEEPRLDIEGFVVDYFTHRIQKAGFEWFDAPALPLGVQPEHKMMRVLGGIFEKKHVDVFSEIKERLLNSPKITFQIYQNAVETIGNMQKTPNQMTYGRLIGLLSFGGLVAATMIQNAELQGQVRNLFLYTALFIKTRIRQGWKEHEKSWADFMLLGERMKEDYDDEKRSRRRWSMMGFTAGAMGILGIVVAGRMIFNCK